MSSSITTSFVRLEPRQCSPGHGCQTFLSLHHQSSPVIMATPAAAAAAALGWTVCSASVSPSCHRHSSNPNLPLLPLTPASLGAVAVTSDLWLLLLLPTLHMLHHRLPVLSFVSQALIEPYTASPAAPAAAAAAAALAPCLDEGLQCCCSDQ
jgi:hypothetical protein